jgi:hypothetical protein
VRFVVTDAGDPVGGARVKLRGRSATTNSSGVATVTTTRGPGTATATKRGYVAATARVTVN